MKKQKKIELNGIKQYAEYIKTQAERDRKNNIGYIKNKERQKKRDNTYAIMKSVKSVK
jgi:hypothetical protein